MATDAQTEGGCGPAGSGSDGFLPGPVLQVPATGKGDLAGLRFAVKDLIDIADTVTGAGNPHWAALRSPAKRTAPVVEQLLSAGASVCGKTVTDELAFSVIGHNRHFGAPSNPVSPHRYTGGSSSGSAAVVAAGRVDFALGTDTAGSVRVPASNCGLFGIRTTHGALEKHGIVSLAPSFDVPGWLALDPQIFTRVGEVLLPRSCEAGLSTVIVLNRAFDLLSGEFADLCRAALERVPPAWVPRHDDSTGWMEMSNGAAHALRVLQAAEAWREHGAWVGRMAESVMAADIRARFLAGRDLDPDTLNRAAEHRNRVRAYFDNLFQTYDAAIAPTVTAPALPRDTDEAGKLAYRERLIRLTCLASLAGLPEVTVPLVCGDDWRAGISLIGPRGSDRVLLRAARELHSARRANAR